MTNITFKGFRGKKPRTDDRLLPDNQATEALNLNVTSGRIDPISGPGPVHTSLAAAITTMYRYRFGEVDNWLVWASDVVDVAKSTTAQDALGRFYYTGDGEPRMSTYALAISGGGPYPDAWYVLGVVPPVTPVGGSVAGGTVPTESRAYVYTFVTALGEESAPSPPFVITGNINGTWNLTSMDTAPPNDGTISAAVADTPSAGFVTVTLDTVRGLRALEEVVFSGVGGMTDLNGTFPLVSVDTATNQVVVELATAQVYSAGTDAWDRVAPHNVTGMKKRIYRTVGTNTDYKFVAEIAVATTTYADTVALTALGSAIETLDSDIPPKNGHSIINLPNGALAMLAGNQLCLSEVYKPYSWPQDNRYAFAGQGVALAAAGNAVIVLTDGVPFVADATAPDAASLVKIETGAPCIAKRGVVDVDTGALYPSHDGLWLVTPGGASKVTQALYRHPEWQETMPESFKATVWDGQYIAMHDTAVEDQDRILFFDANEPDGITEFNLQVDAVYTNPYDGLLYVAIANKIYKWAGDDANRLLAFWQSRTLQIGKPVKFVWAQVHARFSDIVPVDTTQLDANIALMSNVDDVNGALGSMPINKYAINASGIVPVPTVTPRVVQLTQLVDGVPVWTKNVTTAKAFRLGYDRKAEVQALQISTNVPVYSISIAETIEELKAVS